MKKTIKKTIIVYLVLFSLGIKAQSQQQTEELINLLISKNVMQQTDADSLRAALAIKAQDDKAKQTKFTTTASKPLVISGVSQFRFQTFKELGKKDYLDVRKARLDIKTPINERWEAGVLFEFAGTAAKIPILDAYFLYKYKDWLRITGGQIKVPLSAESLISDSKLETIERSQVVEALAGRSKDVIGNQNGRDLGVQASGSFWKCKERFIVDYTVGVFDGAGINAIDNNEDKDFASRILFHPIKGFDIGGAYYSGVANYSISKDKKGVAIFSNYARNRTAAELSYTLKDFNIKAEYIMGRDGAIDKDGWYVQTSYFIKPKKFQVLVKVDQLDPNQAASNDITRNFTGGVNYFFNDNTKLQAFYTYRKEQNTQINNDIIAVQLQLAF